jgi:2-polyprenyl-3-methyl-5-hydroxy-6-metoxy-1,4-benzoquinol methylase
MDNTLVEIENFLAKQNVKIDSQKFISIISNYFHDEESKSYDNSHDEIFSAELLKCLGEVFILLKKNLPGRKLKVLDVGAGTGFLSTLIYDNIEISELHCLEPSSKMLHVLKNKMKQKENIFYHNCTIEELEVFDFDLIVSNSVLHHIPNVTDFLNTIDSRLKGGGYYLVSHEPNFEFYSNKARVRLNQKIRLIERIFHRIKHLFITKHETKREKSIENTVNDLLISEGLIDKPLHPFAIRKLIDIHIPIVGSSFVWGRDGFSPSSIINVLIGYSIIYFCSYEPIRSRYALLRSFGRLCLNARSATTGHNFVSVIQKPIHA